MRISLLLLSFLIAAAPQAQYENAVDFSSVLKFTYEDHHSGLRYGRLRSSGSYGRVYFNVWLPNGTSDVQAGEMAVLYPDGSPIAYATMTTLNTTDLSSIFVLGGSDEEWYTTLEADIEYRYTLSMGDDLLVDFPFEASVSGGDDPYVTSGDKEWALESGPWFTHSFFQQNEEGLVRYFMWLKVKDATTPSGSSYDFEVSIRRGGQEVAWGYHNSSGYMRYFNLRTAASRHESGEFGRARDKRVVVGERHHAGYLPSGRDERGRVGRLRANHRGRRRGVRAAPEKRPRLPASVAVLDPRASRIPWRRWQR